MTSGYPRVAIVGANPLRRDLANGIFLRSLFTGWPREKLVQVYFPLTQGFEPDGDDCSDYRRITATGRAVRVAPGHPAAPSEAAVSPDHGRWLSRLVHAPLLRPWLKAAQEGWYAHSRLDAVLARQLRELAPDGVVALVGNYCLSRITYLACARLGIPVYLLVTEDYAHALYAGMPFARRFQSAAELWLRRLVSRSVGRAAVSPLASREFGARYGGTWDVFYPWVEPSRYDPSPRPHGDTLRLVYTGSLELERWRAVLALSRALAAVRDRGRRAQLVICAPEGQLGPHRAALDHPGITELRGWIAPDQLPALLASADVLVHAESSSPAMRTITRLAFSTKLGQYAMAGRAILGIGPSELGSMQMIRESGAGVTLDPEAGDLAGDALARFLSDAASLTEHGRAARAWALATVDVTAGHARFHAAIRSAFSGARS